MQTEATQPKQTVKLHSANDRWQRSLPLAEMNFR